MWSGSCAPVASCDRLVVRTLRCGRSNPGSNPGHSTLFFLFFFFFSSHLVPRVHENQSVQLGAFSAMGVCHGEIP